MSPLAAIVKGAGRQRRRVGPLARPGAHAGKIRDSRGARFHAVPAGRQRHHLAGPDPRGLGRRRGIRPRRAGGPARRRHDRVAARTAVGTVQCRRPAGRGGGHQRQIHHHGHDRPDPRPRRARPHGDERRRDEGLPHPRRGDALRRRRHRRGLRQRGRRERRLDPALRALGRGRDQHVARPQAARRVAPAVPRLRGPGRTRRAEPRQSGHGRPGARRRRAGPHLQPARFHSRPRRWRGAAEARRRRLRCDPEGPSRPAGRHRRGVARRAGAPQRVERPGGAGSRAGLRCAARRSRGGARRFHRHPPPARRGGLGGRRHGDRRLRPQPPTRSPPRCRPCTASRGGCW